MTEDQKNIILLAIDNPNILTDFEYDFVNDLAELDDERRGYALSDSEDNILCKINDKLEAANR